MSIAAAASPPDVSTLITTIATAVSAIFVAGGVAVGARQLVLSRRAATVTMLAQMIKEWDSPGFKDLRKRAATKMLSQPPVYGPDWLDLMGWFEILALYVIDVRVIRVRDAWNAFSDVLISYVQTSSTEIEDYRRDDRTYFQNLVKLEERLRRFDARQRHISQEAAIPSPAALKGFLEWERDLPHDPGEHRMVEFYPDNSAVSRPILPPLWRRTPNEPRD